MSINETVNGPAIPVHCDDQVPQFDEDGHRVMWKIKQADGTFIIMIHPDNEEPMLEALGRINERQN